MLSFRSFIELLEDGVENGVVAQLHDESSQVLDVLFFGQSINL